MKNKEKEIPSILQIKKFKNRAEAGLLLAKRLTAYRNQDAVILAIPRGGVPLGKIIADSLELPLEIILSKKIGHPNDKEFAIGAVSLVGRDLAANIEVSDEYIEEETKRIRALLQKRHEKFYADRKPISLKNKIAIIVDDGIATGYTMFSTIKMVQQQQPSKVIVAVPVSSPRTIQELRLNENLDQIICILAPKDFRFVGHFYENFEQVSDEEVMDLLDKYRSAS